MLDLEGKGQLGSLELIEEQTVVLVAGLDFTNSGNHHVHFMTVNRNSYAIEIQTKIVHGEWCIESSNYEKLGWGSISTVGLEEIDTGQMVK